MRSVSAAIIVLAAAVCFHAAVTIEMSREAPSSVGKRKPSDTAVIAGIIAAATGVIGFATWATDSFNLTLWDRNPKKRDSV